MVNGTITITGRVREQVIADGDHNGHQRPTPIIHSPFYRGLLHYWFISPPFVTFPGQNISTSHKAQFTVEERRADLLFPMRQNEI